MGNKAAVKRGELLQRRIQSCTSCHLHLACQSPTPPLIPTPIVAPELLLIGEAPGGQEEKQGQPFIGPAGELLFRMLKAELGVHRKQCMVGNVVSCRPTVANKGKVNRPPSRQEMSACRDNLARQIDHYVGLGGRWVVLLGATALGAIVMGGRIGQWSSRPFVMKHKKRLLDVMATYHPSAALRDQTPRMGDTIREHLRYLGALRKDVAGQWPDRCCLCRGEVDVYDGMGVAWCGEHRGYRRGVLRAPAVGMEQGKLVV